MLNKKIKPKDFFDNNALNYTVKTRRLGLVNYVNLDNAATTPPFRAVLDGVNKYLVSYGSVHRGAGTKSKISTDVYEQSREVIKNFVGAPADSYVIFTENTTGAMNAAAYFFSFLNGKVAVSTVEHSSSWLPWIKAEGIKGLKGQIDLAGMDKINKNIQALGRKQVVYYDVNDDFEFDIKDLEKILKKNKIKVVVLTASSNITGYCPDIAGISKIVHTYGAYFVVDGCQYIQHHKIDMKKMGVDFLAASGHKFYAPFGGGFLIGPKKFLDNFLPYQIGGGNLPYITEEGEFLRYKNQLAHDPGTPNAVGAVAMAIALKKIKATGLNSIENYEKKLTLRLFNALEENSNIQLLVNKKNLTTIVTFTIKGQDSNRIAEKLNSDYGIGVRAGSFCVYQVVRKLLKIKDESSIISAVKAGKTEKIPALIRASISIYNTEEDIDRMIAAIKEITS